MLTRLARYFVCSKKLRPSPHQQRCFLLHLACGRKKKLMTVLARVNCTHENASTLRLGSLQCLSVITKNSCYNSRAWEWDRIIYQRGDPAETDDIHAHAIVVISRLAVDMKFPIHIHIHGRLSCVHVATKFPQSTAWVKGVHPPKTKTQTFPS